MPVTTRSGQRRLRLCVAGMFGTFALIAAIVSGLSGADQTFSVISGLLAAWTFVRGDQEPARTPLAELHTHSLTIPAIADEIRRELADHLNTPAGHTAELVAITELLHAASDGAPIDTAPLRRRAAHLLAVSTDISTPDPPPYRSAITTIRHHQPGEV